MTPVCVGASDTKENLGEELFSCRKYKHDTLRCSDVLVRVEGKHSAQFQALLWAALRRCAHEEATQPQASGFRGWCSCRKLQNFDSERAQKNIDASFLKICLALWPLWCDVLVKQLNFGIIMNFNDVIRVMLMNAAGQKFRLRWWSSSAITRYLFSIHLFSLMVLFWLWKDSGEFRGNSHKETCSKTSSSECKCKVDFWGTN